ncbi:MAG: hypothetical protein WC856_02265 [Methylococcaceae bacterium]
MNNENEITRDGKTYKAVHINRPSWQCGPCAFRPVNCDSIQAEQSCMSYKRLDNKYIHWIVAP